MTDGLAEVAGVIEELAAMVSMDSVRRGLVLDIKSQFPATDIPESQ